MGRLLRPSPASLAYVAAVGVLAGLGFTSESTLLILAAVVLALPASVAAVPAYYLAYGVLATLLGGSPDHSTGGGARRTASSGGAPAH